MTRAITVSVERSPSGLLGWYVTIGPIEKWLSGDEFSKLAWIGEQLTARGVEQPELGRVLWALVKELDRKRKTTLTAAVRS